MKGERLGEKYAYLIDDMKKIASVETHIDATNIYQDAKPAMTKLVEGMMAGIFLENSAITGIENIENFLDQVESGKRGLILMEHYSNFDLPGIIYLLHKSKNPECAKLADKIVAIAGMKLNEESKMISAWTEGFNRIVIYPSRSLAAITDPEEYKREEERSKKINFASMRALDQARKRGQVILVFPSGTRYRPGQPETKRGVREIDSYLRLSDIMLLVSVNGNCLRISDDFPKDMTKDIVCEDVILMHANPPVECKTFRNDILATLENFEGDKKQVVVDKIMEELEIMHNENETQRQKLL
jgi:glycerol-3-phosphate O-acyltransferase